MALCATVQGGGGASLRAGLVGAGAVASRHARVLGGLDGVDLVAVTDVDATRAGALADACGAKAVASPSDLLAVGVDAVWVCVPPFAHGAIETEVLTAGLPLFVEKPLAADLPTAVATAGLVRRTGAITATGYHWRHLDTVVRLQRALQRSPAVAATAQWVGAVAPVGWWPRRSGSGGQVVEQATHVLDVLRVLIGEVDEVTAHAVRAGVAGPVDDPEAIDDATVALLRFASGAVASVEVSCVADRPVRAGVTVSACAGTWSLSETTLARLAGGDPVVEEATVDPRVAVDRAFVEAVRTGDPDRVGCDYDEALRTHALGVAITEAARTGTAVRPAELLAAAQVRVSGGAA